VDAVVVVVVVVIDGAIHTTLAVDASRSSHAVPRMASHDDDDTASALIAAMSLNRRTVAIVECTRCAFDMAINRTR
jgi:hypothetical protein